LRLLVLVEKLNLATSQRLTYSIKSLAIIFLIKMSNKQMVDKESILDKENRIKEDLKALKEQKKFLLELIQSKQEELKEVFRVEKELEIREGD